MKNPFKKESENLEEKPLEEGQEQGTESVIPPEENLGDTPEEPKEKQKDKPKKSSKPDINLSEINDRGEYKITITKTGGGLKEGQEKTVSGNVAKALIKKDVAKLS